MRFTLIPMLLFTTLIGFSQATEHGEYQPFASYWFVSDLLKWSPEQDSESKFNVSNIPLTSRFLNDSTKIDSETKIPGIVALMAPHPTGGHPAQGFSTVAQYIFPYWQYIDYFVQWGGSAAEGIILPPLSTWTDAAHKNGVLSIGTVFFPPNVYGGKEEWVYEFLEQREDGSFPLADKLIEVAKTYNFDGWFINQETYELKDGTAQKMVDFLRYYKKNSTLKLIWYDAMITDSRVIWQDELNEHNDIFFQDGNSIQSDAFFINFRYSATNLEDSKRTAQALGRSEWDLYAGIDVQAKSYESRAKWDDLFQENNAKNTSIGLYFSNSTFDISKTKQPEDVYDSEQKFWNGGPETKTRFGSAKWEGFSKYFEPRSVVNELPFKTNFNYGLGRFLREKGKLVSDSEWHNHSIQDILPTWQWQVDSLKVKPTINFTDSYEGGSCISLMATGNAEIPLYKTAIALEQTVSLEVVAKFDQTLQVQFYCILSNGEEIVFNLTKSDDWEKSLFKIPMLSTVKITQLGLRTKGEGQAFLGEVLAYHKKVKRPSTPKFSIDLFSKGSTAEVVLQIEKNTAAFHNIYALNAKGEKMWLGRTYSHNYYLPKVPVINNTIHLMITPVAKDGTEGKTRSSKIKV